MNIFLLTFNDTSYESVVSQQTNPYVSKFRIPVF